MIVEVTNLNTYDRSVPTPANIGIPIQASETIIFSYPKAFEWFFRGLNEGAYNFRVEMTTVPSEITPANPDLDFEDFDDTVNRANQLKIETVVSDDGGEVYQDTYWVLPEDKEAFERAIAKALQAKAQEVTQDAIDAAIEALNEAISEFESKRQLGTAVEVTDTLELQRAIAQANELKDETTASEDGSDIYTDGRWAPQEAIDALESAIFDATDALDAPTQQQVDDAALALRRAIALFQAAQQYGTKPKPIEDAFVPDDELMAEDFGEHAPNELVGDAFSVDSVGAEILVTGSLTYIDHYSSKFEKEDKLTHWYVPLIIEALEGEVIKYTTIASEEIQKTFGVDDVVAIPEDEGLETVAIGDKVGMFLVIPVKKESPTQEFKIYANAENAASDTEPMILTMDASEAVFADPEVKVSISSPKGIYLEETIGNHAIGDLIGDTYLVSFDRTQKTVSVRGTVNKITDFTAYGKENNVTDYFIPLFITCDEGYVVKSDTLFGVEKLTTVEDDGYLTLIFAIKPENPIKTITIYRNAEEQAADLYGLKLTIEAYRCTYVGSDVKPPSKPVIRSIDVPTVLAAEEQIGDRTVGQLYADDYSVLWDKENTVTLGGTLNYVREFTAYGKPIQDKTKWYAPISFNGKIGYWRKTKNLLDDNFNISELTENPTNWIFAIDPESPTRETTIYSSELAVNTDQLGLPLTIDATACTFAEEPDLIQPWDASANLDSVETAVTYGDLIGEDYSVEYDSEGNKAIVTGNIKYKKLTELFDQSVVLATGTYIPLVLCVPDEMTLAIEGSLGDSITPMSDLSDQSVNRYVTYKEIVPVDPNSDSFNVVLYNSEEDAEGKTSAVKTVTVDISQATIAEENLVRANVTVPTGACDSKDYTDLYGSLEFAQGGTYVKATGDLRFIRDFLDEDCFYYLPVKVQTEKALYYTLQTEGSPQVITSDDTSVEIAYGITKDTEKVVIRVFPTSDDKTRNKNYNEYTIDLSEVEYEAGQRFDFNAEKPADMEVEISGKKPSDMVGEDYDLTYDIGTQTITISGKVKKFGEWDAFDENAIYAVPMKLTATDGYLLVGEYLNTGKEVTLAFGQTGDGAGTINLAKSVSPDNLTPTMVVYNSEEDHKAKEHGMTVTFNLESVMFGGIVDYAALQAAIKEATDALNDTAESEDGQDVEGEVWWATSAVKTALSDVVSKYQDYNTSIQFQDEADAGVKAIEEALETFKAARTSVPCYDVKVPEGTTMVGNFQVQQLESLEIAETNITGIINYVKGIEIEGVTLNGTFLVLDIKSTDERATVSADVHDGGRIIPAIHNSLGLFIVRVPLDLSSATIEINQHTEGGDGSADQTATYDISGVEVNEEPAAIIKVAPVNREGNYKGMDYKKLMGEDFTATLNEDSSTITLGGELYQVDDWEQDATANGKYCPAITITAEVGDIIGNDQELKLSFESETNDLVFQFDGSGTQTITIYNDEDEYNDKQNGHTYTVDATRCTFVGLPNIVSVEAETTKGSTLGKNYRELYGEGLKAELKEETIEITGELYQVAEWEQKADAIGKYCPVIKVATAADSVFGPDKAELSSTPSDVMFLFDGETNTQIQTLYRNSTDADAQFHGHDYTVDVSKCTFVKTPKLVSVKAAGQEQSWKGVQYSELMSPDFTATLDDEAKTITCTGTIYKKDKWDAFGEDLQGKNYIVLTLETNNPGVYVRSQKINGANGNFTIAETSEDFVIALDSEHKTYDITLYGNETQGTADINGVKYTIDCTSCIFDQGFQNTLEATKWGFVRKKEELDTVIGAGTSAVADNDDNIFFMCRASEIGEDNKHYAVVVKVDDTYYADNAVGNVQNLYVGLGAGGGQNTDFKFKSSDNRTWTANDVSVDVSNKTVTFEIRKYESDVTLADAATALGTTYTTVLGIQTIDCSNSHVYPAGTFINSILGDRWGFVKTKPELDYVVFPGTADAIDHDTDVFYFYHDDKEIDPENRMAFILTVDGTQYACPAPEAYKTYLMGAGVGASHKTDFNFKSTDGKAWEKNDAAIDVTGKTISIVANTYGEKISDENATTVLATEPIPVFGPQEINCSKSQYFDRTGEVTFANTGFEEWGFLKDKADVDSVESGHSSSIEHENNIFYVKLKEKLETGAKQHVIKISVDDKIYAVLNDDATYQFHYVGLGDTSDADFVSSDGGSTWTASPEAEDVTGKTITLSVVQYGEDVTPENGAELLKTEGTMILGPQSIICSQTRRIIVPTPFVNTLNATKWGYAKTNAELDTLIEQGESAKIDHDSDIFYAVYTKPEHNVVLNITVDGTQYASISDGENGTLVGAGASTSGHATDFDFQSTDGSTWTKNEAAVEVAGKTVSMNLYTYSEDVTNENGPTILATEGTLVLGTQEMVCDQTRSFQAAGMISLDDLSVPQLRKVAKNLGINTNASKAATITRKIRQSGISEPEIQQAIKKVVK